METSSCVGRERKNSVKSKDKLIDKIDLKVKISTKEKAKIEQAAFDFAQN